MTIAINGKGILSILGEEDERSLAALSNELMKGSERNSIRYDILESLSMDDAFKGATIHRTVTQIEEPKEAHSFPHQPSYSDPSP